MADSIEKILAEYKEGKAVLTEAEKRVEDQRAKMSGLLKTLLTTYGKGPYDLGDGRQGGYVIATRGETSFFSPANKRGGASPKSGGTASKGKDPWDPCGVPEENDL